MTADRTHLSESIESYLANIIRLSQDGAPVPLSRLAESLGVSSISVNQMCRKLQDQGLVEYVPYKGVSATPTGRESAARVLRRHRLWEVFLIDHLKIDWQEAHEAACELEHKTRDSVVERLDAYLAHPRVSPGGDPIPTATGDFDPPVLITLAEAATGYPLTYVRCTADAETCAFLLDQGFSAGAPVEVLAAAPERLLVQVGGGNLSLVRKIAAQILITKET